MPPSMIFYSLFYGEGFQGLAQLVELIRLLQSNFFTGKTPVRQQGDVSFLTKRVNASRTEFYSHRGARLVLGGGVSALAESRCKELRF